MKKPVFISHRGVHDHYPENTLESFREAVRQGFEHLETDLRTTKDGHIVLAHDSDLKRVLGRSLVVEYCTRQDLHNISFNNGSRVAFLDEFLENFGHLTCTFDIKPESGSATVQALLKKYVRDPKFKDATINRGRFLFWRRPHEEVLRKAYPQVSLYAREDQCMRTGLASLIGLIRLSGYDQSRIYSLPEHFKGLSLFQEKYVRRFQSLGMRVCAFLPKNHEAFAKAVAAGFDEVLCDQAFW